MSDPKLKSIAQASTAKPMTCIATALRQATMLEKEGVINAAEKHTLKVLIFDPSMAEVGTGVQLHSTLQLRAMVT